MKIAIFSDTYAPQLNGVAMVVENSAKMLSELGHEALVVTAASKKYYPALLDEKRFSIALFPSLPAVIYPGHRFGLPINYSVIKKIKDFKPDIIHSHTPLSIGFCAVLIAKIFGAKLVGTHHTFFDHYLKHIKLNYNWAKKLSWKLTVGYYNLCDLAVSPSQSLADELINNGLHKPVKIVANAVSTNFFKPATPDHKIELRQKLAITGPCLVYMGRISYEKSIDKVILAFAEAVKTISNLKLIIIGDGPERNNLEKLAKKLGLDKSIKFSGFLRGHELVETLQSSDIFITASKSENMPMSILEAMAAGLPIIAVAEKGIPEVVKTGINGFLAKADDHREMASYVVKLCSDDDLLQKVSLASRNIAENHSQKNIGLRLESIYKELITNKK